VLLFPVAWFLRTAENFLAQKKNGGLIFSDVFKPIVFESFFVTGGGVELWNMVYFKGKART
jgi:hypothetical protein